MRYAKDVDKLIIDALKEKVNDLCKNGGVTVLLQKVKKQRIIKARKGGAYPMQQEENYLAQSISQVDVDARYDEGVKRLLANKSKLFLQKSMNLWIEKVKLDLFVPLKTAF